MDSYGINFTFLYVDGTRTSQETRFWASTAWYEDSFTFNYWGDFDISWLSLYDTRCYAMCLVQYSGPIPRFPC
jgi:hypothetical protein